MKLEGIILDKKFIVHKDYIVQRVEKHVEKLKNETFQCIRSP